MSLLDYINWESPRNVFSSSEPGSWTSLEGFTENIKTQTGLITTLLVFSLLLLVGAFSPRYEILAIQLGVTTEYIAGFIRTASIYFIAFFALVAWEFHPKKSVFAIIDFGDLEKNWTTYVMYGGIGAVIAYFMSLPISYAVHIPISAELIPIPFTPTILTSLFIILIAFFEISLLFGAVWPTMAEKLGIVPGAIVASLIFMVLHFGLFGYSIGLQAFSFFFGLLCCFLVGARKSIMPAIIMTIIIDLAGGIVG